jgi:PKD repeat protein
MTAPIAGFTGIPYYGAVPLDVQFTDLSTGIPTSWLWTFGDGETGADQNPVHTYTEVGGYDVTLDATNGDGTGSITIPDAIVAYMDVSVSVSPAVVITPPSIKYCTSFTCMGWVKDPLFGTSGESLIPLAVSDDNGDVRGSEAAMYFEIAADTTSGDHYLAFRGSRSALIKQTTDVDILDGLWHMLAWVSDDTGRITHYVDAVECPALSGFGPDSVLWSKPHTTATRVGGGYVWVPYLDQPGQSITLYNWRYASDLVIHADWIKEIMAVDRVALGM